MHTQYSDQTGLTWGTSIIHLLGKAELTGVAFSIEERPLPYKGTQIQVSGIMAFMGSTVKATGCSFKQAYPAHSTASFVFTRGLGTCLDITDCQVGS